MSGGVSITLDGVSGEVPAGYSVAAVLLNAGTPARHSVSGELRTAFCGMGTCLECRVTIDGIAHRRACMTTVSDGMRIERASGRD